MLGTSRTERQVIEPLAAASALRKLWGFLHPYIGQEAAAAGPLVAIQVDADQLFAG
jgi:TPP-dependent pyruvate/acetoin dehydrogenase alpha subunit